MAESKKKKSSGNEENAVQRPPGGTAGEMLRAARIQKGIGLEEISAAINVRVGQLRAIEEGNLSALPGMTYATGFVKSYATYLKLNSAEIVQKFKAEHGAAPAAQPQQLHVREPAADEAARPNILAIGIAVACLAVLVGAWAIFAKGGDDKAIKQAEQIPTAPAVGTMTGLNKDAPPAQQQPQAAQAVPAGSSVTPTPTDSPPPALPGQKPETQTASPAAPAADAAKTAAPAGPVALPVRPDRDAPAQAEVAGEQPEAAPQQQAAAPPVIKIRNGRSRITLSAKQAAWIRIMGPDGKAVFEKVLHPGDQYFVPDQKGLELTTSNAGGLTIAVDGAEVQQLGGRGEIVRGVDLNPDELKIVKVKVKQDR
jgi:cytoskeleton protein RodZ